MTGDEAAGGRAAGERPDPDARAADHGRSPTASLLARDSRSRALIKTCCYRVLMFATTLVVALTITGDAGAAVDIGLATTVVKTGAYYAYERVWSGI